MLCSVVKHLGSGRTLKEWGKTLDFVSYFPLHFFRALPLPACFMYQSIPKPPIPPRAIPGDLTRVKLRTVGNLTQNEAHPVGHLTFVSKRLSAVGNKRISQFFDSLREPRSQVIAFVDSYVGFSVVVILYSYIVEYPFV